MSSRIAANAKYPYPRPVDLFLSITVPNATAGGDRLAVLTVSQLKQVLATTLKTNPFNLTQVDPALGTCQANAGYTGGVKPFEPTTEDLSIAAIRIVAPIEAGISNILINGQSMGVGCDPSVTAVIFAEVFTVTQTLGGGSGVVQSLANATSPGQIPVQGDLAFVASNAVLTTGVRQIIINVLFWVTPKTELK